MEGKLSSVRRVGLAALISSLMINGYTAPPKSSPNVSKQLEKIIENDKKKSSRFYVKGLELHQYVDTGNVNGSYDIGKETTFIFRTSPQNRYCPVTIPGAGSLVFFVNPKAYPEEKVRISFKDITEKAEIPIIDYVKTKEQADRENYEKYDGKPYVVLHFKPRQYAQEVLQNKLSLKLPTDRRYRLDCYSVGKDEDKPQESCIFILRHLTPLPEKPLSLTK